MQANRPFDLTTYKPRYWLVNGRGFPDAIADNNASWLPYQPYGALALVHPFDASHPYPGLARYLSVGTEDYPFHPHGNNGSVIGRDGNPLVGPDGKDLSFEKFSLNIGPGQTWDVLFKCKDAEALLALEHGAGHAAEPGRPGARDVLRRQPVPRADGHPAAGQVDAQPVR